MNRRSKAEVEDERRRYAEMHYATRESVEAVERAKAFISAYERLCQEHGFELASVDDFGYDGPKVLPLWNGDRSLRFPPEEPSFAGYEWTGPEEIDNESPPQNKAYSDYRVQVLGLPPLDGFKKPRGW